MIRFYVPAVAESKAVGDAKFLGFGQLLIQDICY